MVDLWLIIVTIVAAVLLIFSSFYIYVVYCHPHDKGLGTSTYYKIVVVLGMSVCWGLVLALPLDVANYRGTGGGLNMDLLWKILYLALLVLVVFLLPFSLFLYETDDEKSMGSRVFEAVKLEFCTCAVFLGLLFVAFASMRTISVPIEVFDADSYNIQTGLTNKGAPSGVMKDFDLDFLTFSACFIGFIGWLMFVMFGGIGLIALPMDLILDYIYQPKVRTAMELATKKVILRERTRELSLIAMQVKDQGEDTQMISGGFFSKWKGKRSYKKQFNKLKKDVFGLEQEIEIFEMEEKMTGNPVWFCVKLLVGIIFAIISFVLWIHILLFMLLEDKNKKPVSNVLNEVLMAFEFDDNTFFSTLFFTGFALYMLWCTTKGLFKFGLRIFIIFPIHPMKPNGTWMNSFIFNILLLLVTSVAVVHFCSECFSSYVRYSNINLIFGVYLKKMKFFKLFFENKIFIWVFFGWSVLTLVFLTCLPKKKRFEAQKRLNELKKIARN